MAAACAPREEIDTPVVPIDAPAAVDAAPAAPAAPDAPHAAAPPPPDAAVAWTDAEKCEHMCQSYCVHKHMCDGSDIDACRMAIDDADGGTCPERAHLFRDIPQEKVEACIAAVQAMSCLEFLHMFNTGEGVPEPCHGILI